MMSNNGNSQSIASNQSTSNSKEIREVTSFPSRDWNTQDFLGKCKC
jgi:hypothetical protein